MVEFFPLLEIGVKYGVNASVPLAIKSNNSFNSSSNQALGTVHTLFLIILLILWGSCCFNQWLTDGETEAQRPQDSLSSYNTAGT